jgi:dipeptidyl aminopeptidase/acylaminoacyl peptidase
MIHNRHVSTVFFAFVIASFALPCSAIAQGEDDRYILPDQTVQELFGTDKNFATLDYPSPDGDHFLVPLLTELSTLERMAEETYRLAELEIRPQTDRLWHLDTYGIYGFKVYSLSERSFRNYDMPDGAFGSDFMWSPDGGRLAFLAHLRTGTEVWVADVNTGEFGRVSNARVLATIGTSARGQGSAPSRMLQWTPEGALITLLVPSGRGSEPARNPVPSSPFIRRTRDKANPNPTYPNLLRDEHDAVLFEFYTRSQIAELTPGRPPKLLGEPGMYESISLSPDGQYLMATKLERPFSYIAPYSGFPRKTEVLDREGTVVSTVHARELQETRQRNGGNNGPREWSWRPHRDGSVLTYLLREEESEDENEERRDRLMMLQPPFDTTRGQVLAMSEDPMSGHLYSQDGRHVFVTVTRDGDRGVAQFDLRDRNPARNLFVDFYDPDELFALPGDLITARGTNGLEYVILASNGRTAYLEGPGYQEDYKPQPFVDRVSLRDGSTERLFEGAKESFDRPLVLLDPDLNRMIVSRESKSDFPDSYLWAADGSMDNLTNNVDPFPQITAAQRVDFQYVRRDGLEVQGRISLPIDYRAGDRVPAIFWTYPREFDTNQEYENSAIRARNHNVFTHLSWLRWSDIWLTQGYAIVYPDIPIIGENYNDTYISNMVDAVYGAIRAVDTLGYIDIDRIGHGGHSYGAFATANLLAHTPYFKAGIAGDGAYNRTLTPMGFQAERRDIWEAPQTYLEMSPFFKADQINTPLLMYHGADDNNTGTFPIQSERMMMALTGLGKTAVLYMYPYESHTPRAIENNLDMWARWLEWFNKYVKGEEPENN